MVVEIRKGWKPSVKQHLGDMLPKHEYLGFNRNHIKPKEYQHFVHYTYEKPKENQPFDHQTYEKPKENQHFGHQA